MQIEQIRKYFYDDRTLSGVYVNGSFECFFLEDTDRKLEAGGVKIQGKTAIPRGKYQIVIDWSERFKCLSLHVLDVPQFIGIRIHAGNRPEDTNGCPITGKEVDLKTNNLLYSVAALKDLSLKIYNAILNGEEIWIEIT